MSLEPSTFIGITRTFRLWGKRFREEFRKEIFFLVKYWGKFSFDMPSGGWWWEGALILFNTYHFVLNFKKKVRAQTFSE